MEFNPVIISVITLCTLCLFKINILISLMISAVIAGLLANMSISEIMNIFISGMGKNSETALSYILLGTLAAAIAHSGLAEIFSFKISNIVKDNKYLLIGIIVAISMMSQNLIPVHIAFIPIIIPPLTRIMDKLKIDRRSIACALAFGLKAPYITIPVGFGLIFQTLIADNISENGLTVLRQDVWKYNWILGLGMFIALLIALFITYRKPRDYKSNDIISENVSSDKKMNKSHYIIMFGAVATFLVQLYSGSLPFGALVGLCIIFGFRAISHKKMDILLNEGVGLMGFIAFVMLVCAGYALVLDKTGGIDSLLTSILPYIEYSKFLTVTLMLLIGLIITIGIGSSFGTIPILAVLYVPICVKMGFSVPSTIVILSASAALGDAGSPASDTTLAPSAGLNIDGKHDHIKDTCIPTFIHYNTALIIATYIAVYIFN